MESPEEKEAPDVITSDTNNATQVHPKDAPRHKKAKFRKFRAYNTGMWNGPKRENKEVAFRQDNLHRYDAIASSVLISDHQKKRGRAMLDRLDLREMGLNVDHIIFGICVLVANADVNGGKRYYPLQDDPDEQFVKIADDFDLSESKQASVIEKLRSDLKT